jgi:hypothetical protein
MKPYLKNTHHKKVKWLKVKALSSSPSTAKRKKERPQSKKNVKGKSYLLENERENGTVSCS